MHFSIIRMIGTGVYTPSSRVKWTKFVFVARTSLGELTTIPKPVVGWGGDTPLISYPVMPSVSRSLQRLASRPLNWSVAIFRILRNDHRCLSLLNGDPAIIYVFWDFVCQLSVICYHYLAVNVGYTDDANVNAEWQINLLSLYGPSR